MRPSPAAMVLLRLGVPQSLIADRIGHSQQYVSDQLAGKLPPVPGLLRAIRVVAGPEAADEIAAVLGVQVNA